MSFEETKHEIEVDRTITNSVRRSEIRGENPYPIYDSPLSFFNEDMKSVLPEDCTNITTYLEKKYPEKKGELIGIELGGPGCRLFKDLEPLFKKTAGFTLHNDPSLEPGKNHDVVEADVFYKRTLNKTEEEIDGYQAVDKWTKLNGKADFLIERMVGGISSINIDSFLLIVKRWYKLLSENGTAFIQFPVPSNDVNATIKLLNTIEKAIGKHRDKFDISYKEELFSTEQLYFLLRLHKLPGAPESLDELLKKK